MSSHPSRKSKNSIQSTNSRNKRESIEPTVEQDLYLESTDSYDSTEEDLPTPLPKQNQTWAFLKNLFPNVIWGIIIVILGIIFSLIAGEIKTDIRVLATKLESFGVSIDKTEKRMDKLDSKIDEVNKVLYQHDARINIEENDRNK